MFVTTAANSVTTAVMTAATGVTAAAVTTAAVMAAVMTWGNDMVTQHIPCWRMSHPM